jgi:RHS repeat-associated protein
MPAFLCFLLISILQFIGTRNAGASTVELLSNTNFESGINGTWTANTLAGSTAAGILQGSFPHTPGTWYGYVGNSVNSIGSLFQSFYVPAGAGIATVTFYLNVGSTETATVSRFDLMDVNFRTYSPDTLIKKLGTFSNLDKAADGAYSRQQFTYDLTQYRSQYVVLQFYATNDFNNVTIFRIDDASVSVVLADALPTPSGFSASATSTRITLSWNDVSGEVDYELQWATASTGPWNALGLTGQNGTSFPDNRASAGVKYWYQIRSRNSNGNSAWSSPISAALDYTPYVTTRAATGVGSHSATLNAWINPRGVSTSGSFEYGTTPSYGNATTPITSGLTGTGDQDYSASASGLSASTQYHFRVVSTNVVGQVALGNDLTFTTEPDASAPVAIIAGNLTPVTGVSQYYGRYSTGVGLTYSWSTSDGQSSTNIDPQFAFNAPGSYTITLIVKDSSQRPDTASIRVNVQASNVGVTPGIVIGADPVVLPTGNYVQNRVDLRLPGKGFPSEFRRFYNSQFTDQSGRPLGFGWSFSYNARLTDTGTNVLVIQGDGSTWTFFPTNGTYIGEPGVYDLLSRNADSTWTLTDKSQTATLFDTSGRLLSITDKNTNTLTCTYVAGFLDHIQDTAGRVIHFETNSFGCISAIRDPIQRRIRFEYDDQTNLVRVIDAKNQTNRYSYNSRHQLEDAFDAKGVRYIHNEYDPTNFVVLRQHDAFTNWTTFKYDFANRITYQTNALTKVSAYWFDDRLLVTNILDEATNQQIFSYDANRNRTSILDKNHNETRFAYDERGNVTNKVDALTNVTTIEYNAFNNPIRRVDALTNTTTFGYDAAGNLTSTTNALRLVSAIQYYDSGLPWILTDARKFSTTNKYDPQGNLVAIMDAKGFTNRFDYDDVGRKIHDVDALDRTNSFFYDDNDNLLYTVNALGYTNSFTYDANNNRTSSSDPRETTTTNIFDLKDRLVAVTDALTHTVSNRFDALDRKMEFIDARTNSTRYGFDDVGNLLSITNALTNVISFTYDPNGNQTSLTDAAWHTITNIYDALNRRTLSIDTLKHTNSTGYDALGRILAVTNANDQNTQFFYDAIGRLTNVVQAATNSVFFDYDENGNRIHITDPNGHTWTNVFDELNLLVEQDDPLGHPTIFHYDAVRNLTNKITANQDGIVYSYDALSHLTNIAYPSGPPVAFAYDSVGNRTNMVDGLGSTAWQYDELHRLRKVIDAFGQTVENDFDENGNRVALKYPGTNIVYYGYDTLNRMSSLTNWLGGVITYTYDARNNLVAATNANGTTVAYGYDDASRLVGLTNASPDASVIAAYSLLLDGIGNHKQLTGEQPLFPILPSQSNSYIPDSDNRLTGVDGQSVVHNPNGDLTNIGPDVFGYDYDDRLTAFTLANASGTCSYDGLGNRLVRTVNGHADRFVLDRAAALTQVLLETDTNGSPVAFYVYGLGLEQRITPCSETRTYHCDIPGSTVALSDEAGDVTDADAYDSFGVLANAEEQSSQPFRYLGKYGIIDDGLGLSYARARYYSPKLGRFLTKDPITGKDNEPQSLNRFAYGLNNPLRLIDVTGMSATEGRLVSSFGLSDANHALLLMTEQERRIYIARLQAQTAQQDYINALEVQDAYYQAAINYFSALKHIGDAASWALVFVTGGESAAAQGALEGATAKGVTSVYSAVENGTVKYIGITDNFQRRAVEQLTERGIIINEIPGLTSLSRSTARGVEQVLIEQYGLEKNGGTLVNRINSISDSNPIYQNATQRGIELLKQAGIPGF